jgi:PAT family beta-lactamase induction signal transducer AmpG
VTELDGRHRDLAGAFVGGVMALRWGVMRISTSGRQFRAPPSNLLFAWVSGHGHDVQALIFVVSADNLGQWHCLRGCHC